MVRATHPAFDFVHLAGSTELPLHVVQTHHIHATPILVHTIAFGLSDSSTTILSAIETMPQAPTGLKDPEFVRLDTFLHYSGSSGWSPI
jgi:hypothetical protein